MTNYNVIKAIFLPTIVKSWTTQEIVRLPRLDVFMSLFCLRMERTAGLLYFAQFFLYYVLPWQSTGLVCHLALKYPSESGSPLEIIFVQKEIETCAIEAKIMELTTNFTVKYQILCIRKCLISGHKAEKQLRNQNHTDDWAPGCHPRDKDHVTR